MRIQLPERWNYTVDETFFHLNDLGGLLLSSAELKGHNQAAHAYKSPRWFPARALCAEVIDAPQSINGTFITVMRCECCQGSCESWIYLTTLNFEQLQPVSFHTPSPIFNFQLHEIHDKI